MPIQKDDIDSRIDDSRKRSFSTVNGLNIALASQSECIRVCDLLFVVDDEHVHIRRAIVSGHLFRLRT
jgi:hypothetical protein